MSMKINQAYTIGTAGAQQYLGEGNGAHSLAEAIDFNFGVSVDHYMVVNFKFVINVIDEVGGLDVYLPQEVEDDYFQKFSRLADYLNGGGVPSIETALNEHILAPVLDPVRELINPGILEKVQISTGEAELDEELLSQILDSQSRMLYASSTQLNKNFDLEKLLKATKTAMETLFSLSSELDTQNIIRSKKVKQIYAGLKQDLIKNPQNFNIILIWIILRFLAGNSNETNNLSLLPPEKFLKNK